MVLAKEFSSLGLDFNLQDLKIMIRGREKEFLFLVFLCSDPRIFDQRMEFLAQLKKTFPTVEIVALCNPGGAKVLKDEAYRDDIRRKIKFEDVGTHTGENDKKIIVIDVLHEDCRKYAKERIVLGGSIMSTKELNELMIAESDNLLSTLDDFLPGRIMGMIKYLITLDFVTQTGNRIVGLGGFVRDTNET